jgi:Integrase core domain
MLASPSGGFFHIDIAEVQTAEGKLYLFVGIDRTSKFAVAQLVETADRKTAWEFLQHTLEAVPYQVHTILIDRAIGTPLVRETMARGIQFAEQPRNRNTIYSRPMRFDRICEADGIEHRLTKPNHPWTNGQDERINRTIKDATENRFQYDSHGQLRTNLADFVAAYNFARRLKTLNGLRPTNAFWHQDRERQVFRKNYNQLISINKNLFVDQRNDRKKSF